jgi:D-amino-acid dehydrogenase
MSHIGIIGGGIIGSATAAWLAADGHEVTLFERDPDGKPTSAGNAGFLALPEISPVSRPSVMTSVPGWLLDPLGPLALRMRDLPELTPWLARFVAAARPGQVAHATASLAVLMKTALADHQELARRGHLGEAMRRTGAFHIFDSERGFRAVASEWAERTRHGVDVRPATADEVRRTVPALTGPFTHALFAPDYWLVTSPAKILASLRRRIESRAVLVAAEIVSLRRADDGILLLDRSGTERRFDKIVVAAGIWSRDLVRQLGLSVSLETERGYNTTFAARPFDLPVPVFFADHGFVAAELDDGLRIGGGVELARPDAPPNYARAEAMVAKAQRYFPDIPASGGRQWMGRRPSTPDSLPVIGRHPEDGRIVFAFGHGHLGLTLSAVTARHVAALLGDRPPDPLLKPFGIERFQ